jgi:short-subunit dehydrogenase
MSDQCHHRLLRSPDTFVVLPGAMVDAALAGLDQGEFATVPSLPNLADWNAYEAAKQALMPNLSRAVRASTGESASWAHDGQSPIAHISR